ncbi:MAG TPA: hypothetical protein VK704_01775 [Acidimicrobiales bacterium]|nr:hypothetical protein [Acidimicrobiales bacterium]
MNEGSVIMEQQLRSSWISAIIGGIALLYVVLATLFLNSASSIPTVALVVVAFAFVVQLTAIVLFLRVVVRVVQMESGRALLVAYGPGGHLRQVFEPSEIESAQVRELSFTQMGGFGYRGSLRLLRRAALSTRRGDALELHLTRGRKFFVTVDDPADFVSALSHQ